MSAFRQSSKFDARRTDHPPQASTCARVPAAVISVWVACLLRQTKADSHDAAEVFPNNSDARIGFGSKLKFRSRKFLLYEGADRFDLGVGAIVWTRWLEMPVVGFKIERFSFLGHAGDQRHPGLCLGRRERTLVGRALGRQA